jgi:hypothetical protein
MTWHGSSDGLGVKWLILRLLIVASPVIISLCLCPPNGVSYSGSKNIFACKNAKSESECKQNTSMRLTRIKEGCRM